MRSLRQLEFAFEKSTIATAVAGVADPGAAINDRGYNRGRDLTLESKTRELLRSLGAEKLARKVRVEWNPRLQTTAGSADYREKLISLNRRLCHHAADEIERTLRHELAHLLAQFRSGRRRISPHGPEWRQACRDLDIADERRCHNLPFPAKSYPPRFVYRCPNCRQEFPRVRRARRAVACLACCRAHNGGGFDVRFRLRLVHNLEGHALSCPKNNGTRRRASLQ